MRAHVRCIEYRAGHIYDLAAVAKKKEDIKFMDWNAESGQFKYFPTPGYAMPCSKMASETKENKKSSRGHCWFEVRRQNKDGRDLGMFTFFDLRGLEKMQTQNKAESQSLTIALEALKVPFKAIANRSNEWEAPNGNSVYT
ncbi:hypothetical protein ACEQ8H_008520 [Pleosporales sp. CAS-2024a]